MALLNLHGVVPKGTRLNTSGPPHHLVECGAVTALVSEFPDAEAFESLPPEDVANWALAHNAILMGYCADVAVLPMRVGAVFSDEAAVRAEIEERSGSFSATLTALTGIHEYAVQLSVLPDTKASSDAAGSGRDHLLQRRQDRDRRAAREQDRQALARAVLDQINALALQVEPAGAPKPDRVLDCVVLLPRDRVPILQGMIRSLGEAATALDLDLVVTGPWPPYSFDITAMPELAFPRAG